MLLPDEPLSILVVLGVPQRLQRLEIKNAAPKDVGNSKSLLGGAPTGAQKPRSRHHGPAVQLGQQVHRVFAVVLDKDSRMPQWPHRSSAGT